MFGLGPLARINSLCLPLPSEPNHCLLTARLLPLPALAQSVRAVDAEPLLTAPGERPYGLEVLP